MNIWDSCYFDIVYSSTIKLCSIKMLFNFDTLWIMQIRSSQYVLDWSSWLWRLLNTQKVVSSILALSIKFLTFSIIKWLNIFVNGHSEVCRVWPNPFFFAIGCGIWRGSSASYVSLTCPTGFLNQERKNRRTKNATVHIYTYIHTLRTLFRFLDWIRVTNQ